MSRGQRYALWTFSSGRLWRLIKWTNRELRDTTKAPQVFDDRSWQEESDQWHPDKLKMDLQAPLMWDSWDNDDTEIPDGLRMRDAHLRENESSKGWQFIRRGY